MIDSRSRQRGGVEAIELAADAAAPGSVSLGPGSLLNMELSNLAFQQRVADMAADPSVPLLERVRFLAILGSNLDEFFMTRVAGFKRQIALGNTKRTLDGLMPDEQLRLIGEESRKLLDRIYHVILPDVVGELEKVDIRLLTWDGLEEAERDYLRVNYLAQLDAVVTPLVIPGDSAFPHVRNLRPALLITFTADEGGRCAVVELPNDLPRLLPLPGGRRFIPLEEVIRESLPRLLDGEEIRDAYAFRVTRSGNLTVDAETTDDIVDAVSENVALRPFQPVVRIEVESGIPDRLAAELVEKLALEAKSRLSSLGPEDVYRVDGLIDLNRLQQLAALPLPDLRYEKLKRTTPFKRAIPMIEQLAAGDIMVRFPRNSFEATVERFVREAADDPAVESISITLYRTSRSSKIVKLLRRAHRHGKRIVAVIEVKASFDESRNIEWARMLEAAGIRVTYGPPSIKVHAKIASIKRREGNKVRLYSYIGTGNLNASTAATYTDLGLFTASEEIGGELDDLFDTMAGMPSGDDFSTLVVAPFNMRRRFLEMIRRESAHAREGRGGAITIKLNGIADREIIAALYEASAAGVRVDLSVRAICCLRPGVEGLSENIRVSSVVGRFLEHSRIFRFHNAGDPEYYIGSADWRGRNLSRRVEVVVPIVQADHRALLDSILAHDLYSDNHWELQPDGTYIHQGAAAPADQSAGAAAER